VSWCLILDNYILNTCHTYYNVYDNYISNGRRKTKTAEGGF